MSLFARTDKVWREFFSVVRRWGSAMAIVSLVLASSLRVDGAPAAPANQPAIRPGRLLIKPRAGVDRKKLQQLHGAEKAKVFREFRHVGGVLDLQLPANADVAAVADRYQRSGLVEFAEPDRRLDLAVTPNEPTFANGTLWHLNNIGLSGGTLDADIDAPEAWDTLRYASNVIVAIVDSGARYTHEDLAANMWVNPGEIPGNGIDDDGNGFVDDVHGINAAANDGNPTDLIGHGTQVAGYIGAVGNNGLGTVGVAWKVQIMVCRFYDDAGNGFLTDAVQAFDYARANGAQVINASFVSTFNSPSLFTAVSSCRSAGIIVVCASGNDAVNTDATPYYPAGFNLDNVVAVAATTRNDTLATFSNYGATTVDLAAPGQDVFSTSNTGDSDYALNSGTSFASPIVAGAMALMRARYPAAPYRQLIDQVLNNTDPLPSLSGKCVTGGRLNIARALGATIRADFAATPPAGSVPLTVQFTNLSSGVLASSQWFFGDGGSSTSLHPSHVYATPGTYNVSLVVTSPTGVTSSTNRSVVAVSGYQMTNATFSWIDPTAMPSLGLTGDAVSPAQTLPFSFSFYGQGYSSIYVAANGLLGFENTGLGSAANTDLPSLSVPNNIICPFWDDLSPTSVGVHMGTVGTAPNRRVVVSWVGVTAAGGGNPPAFTFQVVLEETSNDILFQYLEVQPNNRNNAAAGKTATIGIEHGSGLVAKRFSYNGSTLLANSQAIRFSPLGVSIANVAPVVTITNPPNGTILTAPASVTFGATASDSDGSVVQVEFFSGTTSLAIDSTSPFSAAVTGLAVGDYTFSAVATDNLGARATNAVSVVVKAPIVAVTLVNARWVRDGLAFSFASEAGASYVVEAASSPAGPIWQTVTNLTGNGGTMDFTNHAPGTDLLFFRVESH